MSKRKKLALAGIDKCIEPTTRLVHVKVALQDAFLHSIWNLWLSGHFASRGFHDSDALGSMMVCSSRAQHRGGTRNGASLSPGTNVFGKIISFTCSMIVSKTSKKKMSEGFGTLSTTAGSYKRVKCGRGTRDCSSMEQ